MGIWSTPWENEIKAKEFALKIKEGFLIKVENSSSSDDLEIYSDEISFRFDEKKLIGSDDLYDQIYDEALELEENFDAKKIVISVIEPLLKCMELQPDLPKELISVNIVRESIGLPILSADREIPHSIKIARKIIQFLKDKNIDLEYYDLRELNAPLNPMIKKLNRIPEDLQAEVYYGFTIETVEKIEFQLDFSSIKEVKGFGFDRPGLFRMCFVLS